VIRIARDRQVSLTIGLGRRLVKAVDGC
jgi:hypothetical protein